MLKIYINKIAAATGAPVPLSTVAVFFDATLADNVCYWLNSNNGNKSYTYELTPKMVMT